MTIRDQPARLVGDPAPGLYKIRKVRGGPEVAAAIVLEPTPDPWFPENPMVERPHYWSAVVDGEPEPLTEIKPTDQVWRIHEWGVRVDRETYQLMIEQSRWDRTYNPAAPGANPDKRVDLEKSPTFF